MEWLWHCTLPQLLWQSFTKQQRPTVRVCFMAGGTQRLLVGKDPKHYDLNRALTQTHQCKFADRNNKIKKKVIIHPKKKGIQWGVCTTHPNLQRGPVDRIDDNANGVKVGQSSNLHSPTMHMSPQLLHLRFGPFLDFFAERALLPNSICTGALTWNQ